MYKRVFKQKGSRVYRVRYRLSDGPRIYDEPLRTHVKEVAEAKASRLIEEKEKELLGLLPSKSLRDAAGQPIGTHLAEFIAHLVERKRCEDHVRHARERLTALFKACRWRLVRDINADDFLKWRMRQTTLSAKTLNEYLGHATAFLNWLERNGRFTHNPLKGVVKLPKAPTFQRRALTLEEFVRLVRECGKRWWIYFLVCCSGLRRGELKQLLWTDIRLDAEEPFIELRAETTKNKKGGRIPLVPALAEALRRQKASRTSKSGLVLPRGVPHPKTLAKDLTACGIPAEDERGYRVDFHALRYTFVSLLAHVKASELVRMKLARHSAWKQTDGYTDEKSVPLGDGIALLAAALPSSIASRKNGNSWQEMGNGVQGDPSAVTGEVVPITDNGTTLAKAVPYWESGNWRRGGDSNPR